MGRGRAAGRGTGRAARSRGFFMAVGTVWNGLEWFVLVVPRSRAPLVASGARQCGQVPLGASPGGLTAAWAAGLAGEAPLPLSNDRARLRRFLPARNVAWSGLERFGMVRSVCGALSRTSHRLSSPAVQRSSHQAPLRASPGGWRRPGRRGRAGSPRCHFRTVGRGPGDS